jgi:hypothetical protein
MIAVAAAVLALLVACAGAPPATPRPTLGPLRVERPTPAPTPTPYGSGGLGLFRDEVEALYGNPLRATGRVFEYRGGTLSVAYALGLAGFLEKTWPEPRPFEAARDESGTLIPGDARLVRYYETRWFRRIQQFVSPSLASRFQVAAENFGATNPWAGMEPGTFIVVYVPWGDSYRSVQILIGSTPFNE